MSESHEDDSAGPTTRKISYLPRDERTGGVQAHVLSEDDARSERERARRRVAQSAAALRTTLSYTMRDVVLATRGLSACVARWLAAHRAAPGAREGD